MRTVLVMIPLRVEAYSRDYTFGQRGHQHLPPMLDGAVRLAVTALPLPEGAAAGGMLHNRR